MGGKVASIKISALSFILSFEGAPQYERFYYCCCQAANCTRVFSEDNQACNTVSENTVHRQRSRHIDVRKYHVRELVEEKLIKLMPCGTKVMRTDALTDSLPYPSFRTHRNTMLDATWQQKMLKTTSLRVSACWTWA